jgi:dTDP-4-dehydrorhamnose reductase
MKVLIAGGSGLVGRCLIELLESKGIPYVSTYNSRPSKNGYKINFEDEVALGKFLDEEKPTVSVNCIVQRLTDICEKNWDETKRTNIDIVDTFSRACNQRGIQFIHISTDYIFDGKKAPYGPNSIPNPLQNYGISKLIAEQRVIANAKRYSIVRVPVLYCDKVESLEENAVTLIGKKVLNQLKPTVEDNYSIRRPVYIPDMCVFIVSLIGNRETGIYHFYNPSAAVTKYDMAVMIANYLGKSHSHIKPSDLLTMNVANRPYDTQLEDTSYDREAYPFTSLITGLDLSFKRFKHPDFTSDCFVVFDLDGTLVYTDTVHYECYNSVLKDYGIILSWKEFETCINTSSVDAFLREKGFSDDTLKEMKQKKNEAIKQRKHIRPVRGAEEFITGCIEKGANIVVVTNTTRSTAEHFKTCMPFLNRIENWVCKEDYVNPKPDSECIRVAIERFYKGESYKIGFENTINGFNAMKELIPCVYMITDTGAMNYPVLQKEDVFLIRDYEHFTANI